MLSAGLAIAPNGAYHLNMASTVDHPPAPPEWVESLERSKAQIEAGRDVPLGPVLERLKTSADRMEAARAKRPLRKA